MNLFSVNAAARRADIQMQFLVESVTVTLAGSAIGFVVGIIIAQAGTAGFRLWAHASIYPVMHLSTGLLAAGSAIAVGLVFGTIPRAGRPNSRPWRLSRGSKLLREAHESRPQQTWDKPVCPR